MNIKKRLAIETLFYASSSVVMQTLGFLSMIMLMQHLSVRDFGAYSFVMEWVLVFGVISETGFRSFYIRRISASLTPERTYSIVQASHLVIGSMIFLVSLIATAIVYPDYLLQVMLAGGGYAALNMLLPINAYFVSLGEKRMVVLRDVVYGVGRIAAASLVAYCGLSVFYAYSVHAITFLLLLGCYLGYKRHSLAGDIFRIRHRRGYWLALVRSSVYFNILVLANTLYNKIDVFMIEKILGLEPVGQYAAAYRIIYPLMFVSNALMTGLYPRMVRAKEGGGHLMASGLKYMLMAGISVCLICAASADLIYGHFLKAEYSRSISTYLIMLPYLPLVFVYGVFTNAIVAAGMEKFLVPVNIVAMLIKVVLNAVLLRAYGIDAAAATTVLTELFILVTVAIFCKNKIGFDGKVHVGIVSLFVCCYFSVFLMF